MLFRKCYPEHLLLIEAQAVQRRQFSSSLGMQLGALKEGEAYSGWHDNRCLMAGGVYPKWRGVASGWTVLSDEALAKHMIAITRKTRQVVRDSEYRRVEMYVAVDHEAGHRWAQALGFTLEAERMRGYDPDGRDMAMYAYVRGK